MVPILSHTVVGLDSDLFEQCTFCEGIHHVQELRVDLRDVQAKHLDGFDAVIHLAALANDPLGDLNPRHHVRDQPRRLGAARPAGQGRRRATLSLLVVLQQLRQGGRRPGGRDGRAAPDHRLRDLEGARRAKRRAAGRRRFSPTFLRNATAYGVSPRLRFDLVLNNLTAWAFAKGRVHIKSDGTPWRPIVHIEDISRAFLAVLAAPRDVVHNQALNVGQTEENYRIRQLADIVQDVVPGSRVEYAADGGPDPRCYRVDFGKIRRLLPELKPQWNARRGAEDLYAAYREGELVIEDAEGPRFKRIDHLKHLLATGRLDPGLRWKTA